jgi:Amt family ammonium transporter
LLAAQAIGSATITLATFSVALVVMYAVHALGVLRVSQEGETLGLDLHEHGISAYPEYVISSVIKPAALVLEPSGQVATQPSALRTNPAQSGAD